MISDELLAELKQILWEDYQIQLTDNDLKLFAENVTGIFSQLVKALSKKQKELDLIISKDKKKESNQ